MIIKDPVLGEYLIEVDKYQYSLMKPAGSDKNGKQINKFVGHFNTLESCLKYVVKNKLSKRNDYCTLNKYIEEFRRELNLLILALGEI